MTDIKATREAIIAATIAAGATVTVENRSSLTVNGVTLDLIVDEITRSHTTAVRGFSTSERTRKITAHFGRTYSPDRIRFRESESDKGLDAAKIAKAMIEWTVTEKARMEREDAHKRIAAAVDAAARRLNEGRDPFTVCAKVDAGALSVAFRRLDETTARKILDFAASIGVGVKAVKASA